MAPKRPASLVVQNPSPSGDQDGLPPGEDRKQEKALLGGSSSSRAARWSRKRPRGPQYTVNDSITALETIFSVQDFSPKFTFLDSGDFLADDSEDLPTNNTIINQPDSRPISQSQLAAEVKGIYSGLVIIEGRCVAVVNAHAQAMPPHRTGKQQGPANSLVPQLPALIALHRTLLHEHHDFFLASQHPSAGKGIKELATKYSMPARMWKHGIHNFLELLRHQLPDSLDYMLAFIHLAYRMMALLFETVPTFEDTWIECLGDLARYRMAIEDDDLRDREVWTGVARFWYIRAADKNPDVGRLSHHLGILARSNPLDQLSLYCRSLTATQPFISSRESILTLFEPAMARLQKATPNRPLSNAMWFVIVHACMFGVTVTSGLLDRARASFLGALDAHIAQHNTRWCEAGAYIASCNIAAILKYGCTTSTLREIVAPQEKSSDRPSCPEPWRAQGKPETDDLADYEASKAGMSLEWRLTFETCIIELRRVGDPNVLPSLGILLVFFNSLACSSQGAACLNRFTPWDIIADYINAMNEGLDRSSPQEVVSSPTLPHPEELPLPEDYLLRGQAYSKGLYPTTYFAQSPVDIDERSIEQPSFTRRRANRVKWLAARLALSLSQAKHASQTHAERTIQPQAGQTQQQTRIYRWLHYDPDSDQFSMAEWSSSGRSQRPSPQAEGEPMPGVTAL